MPNLSPEKQEKRNFGLKFSIFEQDRLLFAGVEIGVTGFPTKNSQKRKNKKMGLRFFFQKKVGVRIPFSVGNFHFLGRGTTIWGGGGKTSKLASQ